MRILALDDEKGALKLLAHAIRWAEPEAELRSFTSPKEALAAAEKYAPDVAFLDIKMPEINGLEVAKKLKKMNPGINVIFTTGFNDYAVEAMRLRSSGYLLKPVIKEEVKTELENLRYPVSDAIPEKVKNEKILIKTFGSFEVYLNGEILDFRMKRAKEALAYLVDRQGASVTRKELAAVIFEDKAYSRSVQTYLSQITGYLTRICQDNGISQILRFEYNSYAVDPEAFMCDSYDYQRGVPDAINLFHGEYMNQYSWGEGQLYRFYE